MGSEGLSEGVWLDADAWRSHITYHNYNHRERVALIVTCNTPHLHTISTYTHLFILVYALHVLVLTGKGHTLTWLHSQGIFPLDAFVRVSESLIPLIMILTHTVSL